MSEEKRSQAYARATVVLELPLDSVYGPEWTVEAIHKDAQRGAAALIEQLLRDAKVSEHFRRRARATSIKVEAVIVPEGT